MEIVFSRYLLQEGVTLVFERAAVSVPIYREGVNAHLFCFFDLLAKYGGIESRVSDVNMPRGSKPRLIIRQNARRLL